MTSRNSFPCRFWTVMEHGLRRPSLTKRFELHTMDLAGRNGAGEDQEDVYANVMLARSVCHLQQIKQQREPRSEE